MEGLRPCNASCSSAVPTSIAPTSTATARAGDDGAVLLGSLPLPPADNCMKSSARRLRGWLADLHLALSAAPAGEHSAARAFMTLSSGAIGAAAAQQHGEHRSAAAAAAAAARAGGSTAACARSAAVPQQLRAASLAPADRKRSLLRRAAAAAAGAGPSGAAAAATAVQPTVPNVLPFTAAGQPIPVSVGSSAAAATEAAAAPAQSAALQPAAEAPAVAAPVAAAAAAASVSVEGTVQRVTFRAEDTGYTVLRLQLPPGSLSSSSSSLDGSAGEADEVLAAAAAASAGAANPAGKRGRSQKPIIVVVGNLPQVGGW